MDQDNEVIALLLGGSEECWPDDEIDWDDTTCLVRKPDGNVSLEKLDSREELERTAEQTGIFRKGKPIRDPETGEVIGYELEEVMHLKVSSA